MKNLLLITIMLLGVFACKTGKETSTAKTDSKVHENVTTVTDPQVSIDLTDHLRKVPGVWIQGTGGQATIRIRGNAGLQTSGEPLFIVNGSQINGGYGTVYNMVGNVNDIKTIQVLKDPSETSFYGVRGSNGVIIIKLK